MPLSGIETIYTNSVGAIKETEYKIYFRTDFDLKNKEKTIWRLIKENILLIGN